ncbi:3256_t:CDS:1 [Cetraspora pellucida]|uniref:3256_t:CDS:1 n=1 Tax=Cetraspora pellucida TaxID=1433469 RepID=A0ACA9NKF2_9GLOM|nr:3256_t:CDS:1 [Cetraspora pellucida]
MGKLLKRSSRNSNKTEIIYTSQQAKKIEEEETQTPATITGDTSDSEDNAVETDNEEEQAFSRDESVERVNNEENVFNNSDINSSSNNGIITFIKFLLFSILKQYLLSHLNVLTDFDLLEKQLLRVITVESNDRSLALSLDTEYTSQSLTVNANVKSVTIIPIPTQKHVRMNVLHNGQRRVKPYRSAEPNSVAMTSHTYVVSLREGLNLIDIWIRPFRDNDFRKEKKPKRKSRRLASEEDVNDGESRAIDKGKMKEYVEREDNAEGTDPDNSEIMHSDEEDDYNLEYSQKYELFITRLEMNVAK